MCIFTPPSLVGHPSAKNSWLWLGIEDSMPTGLVENSYEPFRINQGFPLDGNGIPNLFQFFVAYA